MLTEGALREANNELDKLLEVKPGKPLVSHETLKTFLRANVIPLLQSTTLDRRSNTAALRTLMCKLVRNAAYSANVLHARPSGGFVRFIVESITCDARYTQFMREMSSAQASKITEALAEVGVRDGAVHAALIVRLDFANIRDVARVMMSLSEAGLHHVNVYTVIPLYCFEKWELEYYRASSKSSSNNNNNSNNSAAVNSSCEDFDKSLMDARRHVHDGQNCSLYEAIRVLRAMSKSVRVAVHEHQRKLQIYPVNANMYSERKNEEKEKVSGKKMKDENSLSGNCHNKDADTLKNVLDEDDSKNKEKIMENINIKESEHEDEFTPGIPYESIGAFRDRVLVFIFSNLSVLRGGHLINLARALINFPVQITLSAETELTLRSISFVKAVLEHNEWLRSQTTLTCMSLALVAVEHLFMAAFTSAATQESRSRVDNSNNNISGNTEIVNESSLPSDAWEPLVVSTSESKCGLSDLDVALHDVAKLLYIMQEVYDTHQTRLRESRTAIVMNAVLSEPNKTEVNFASYITMLQELRTLRASPEIRTFMYKLVQEMDVYMQKVNNITEIASTVSLTNMAQFASILVSLRVNSCDGFVRFMVEGVKYFPPRLSVEVTSALLHALCQITRNVIRGKDSMANRRDWTNVVNEFITRMCLNYNRLPTPHHITNHDNKNNNTNKSNNDHDDESKYFNFNSHNCLLAYYPLECTRIWRALVLLNVIPSPALLFLTFGVTGQFTLTSRVRMSTASTVFDLSRSITALSRERAYSPLLAIASHRNRVHSTDFNSHASLSSSSHPASDVWEDEELECEEYHEKEKQEKAHVKLHLCQLLWSRGVVATLLPATVQFTEEMCHSAYPLDPSFIYIPSSWRSVLETIIQSIDLNLDSISPEELTHRVTEIYPLCTALLTEAGKCAMRQINYLMINCTWLEQLHKRFNAITFSLNATLHFVSLLLMLEDCIFHASWKVINDTEKIVTKPIVRGVKRRQLEKNEKGDNNNTTTTTTNNNNIHNKHTLNKKHVDASKQLFAIKQDYLEFIQKSDEETNMSALQIIHKIFNMPFTLKNGNDDKKVNIDKVSVSNIAQQFPVGNGTVRNSESESDSNNNNIKSTSQCNVHASQSACLLTRMHVIEITSNLPFAISLVVEPGPVNEYFCENALPIMLSTFPTSEHNNEQTIIKQQKRV